jgi:hypothetical protein
MYKFLKNLTPLRDSNPGSSVRSEDAMTTVPRRDKNTLHSKSFSSLTKRERALIFLSRRRGLVVSSPPATEEIGAMGREIESH